jgi:hypothetical protein
MRAHRSNLLCVSRVRPLVACLAIAFSAETFATSDSLAVAVPLPSTSNGQSTGAASGVKFPKSIGPTPNQPDTVLLVQNCNDAGPNSLRDAVQTANTLSGDVTIEFDGNAMQCSTITLTSGEITITKDDMTFQGPGANLLTIDGGYSAGYYNRIFNHTGIGTLAINDLSLTDAKYIANAPQNARGGCVYGYTVNLAGAKVSDCHVIASGGSAFGGGIAARFSFTMLDSSISNCEATSGTGTVSGGGIFAGSLVGGSFTAKYSAVENNTAHTYSQNFTGDGGGIVAKTQSVLIQRSIISGNHAERAGGLYVRSDAVISDSTISENQAAMTGGIYMPISQAVLYNSTIAFNKATQFGRTAGLTAQSVKSNSSIFAYNVTDDGSGAVETDVKSGDGLVTGANNLIIATVATTPPADTSNACPRFAPLLDNGGVTRTHALLPGSPAIDTGNNVAGLDTDQRGSGFDRIVGAAADIGAYEWSAASGDVIYSDGFETCD